jgi:hypothetical protein
MRFATTVTARDANNGDAAANNDDAIDLLAAIDEHRHRPPAAPLPRRAVPK